MKITIVAFDIWGFNKFIVNRLITLGHEVTFINSFEIRYIYKNKWQRLSNFISKTLFNKNIKKIYIDETLVNTINDLPVQDQILIINPSYFKDHILNLLKTKTKKFLAYNYDSLVRMPLPANHETLLDEIFSFDLADTKQYKHLKLLTNFNYLDKNKNLSPKNKAFMILSKSEEREQILHQIAKILDHKNIPHYEFIILNPALPVNNPRILTTNKHLSLIEVEQKMKDAEILIDLVRDHQTGLSFRVFEAMALHKKLITNNKTIETYDFYNPNNILILDDNFNDIPESFLKATYEDLPDEVYKKYTVDGWIEKVFNF